MAPSAAVDLGYGRRMIAALAEALHLDGYHLSAAYAFAGLAASDEAAATYALKAAASFYAADDDRLGDEWLELARALGAPGDQMDYLDAQRLWARGDLAQAVRAFETAMARYASSDLFAPALAMLLVRAGRRDDARKLINRAWARVPNDPYVAINAVILNLGTADFLAAAESLRVAARRLPQRAETHVLYARLRRRHGLREYDASRKASLRKTYLGPSGNACAERQNVQTARAHVTGTLSLEMFGLSVTFRFENSDAIPTHVLVNAGYSIVCRGRPLSPFRNPHPTGAGAGLTPEHAAYRLDPSLLESSPDGFSLTLKLSGRPRGPAVRLTPQALELGEGSAWLPILSPPIPTRWTTDLSTGSRLRCFVSSGSVEERGIALLAVIDQGDDDIRKYLGGSAVLGAATPAARQFASTVFEHGKVLWREAVGLCRAGDPPLIIVDREDSTFCYARAGFVRAASRVIRDDRSACLLLHEAGHLWWGVDVRFEPESQWLAEALAEYTLHLAERRGLLPGYASSSLRMLQRVGQGRLSDEGLRHLAHRQDRVSAHLARVRGGFVISALREILGDTGFWATLKAVHEEGRHGLISDYSFFALAASIHGSPLTWFVNQWAHVRSDLHLVVDASSVERVGDAYETRFTAEAIGSATPGADIYFGVRTREGMDVVALNLDLGTCPASVRTLAKPLAIVPDPNVRWPASRVVKELAHVA
jgi:tetratricopeptide (TPR) repeat protein